MKFLKTTPLRLMVSSAYSPVYQMSMPSVVLKKVPVTVLKVEELSASTVTDVRLVRSQNRSLSQLTSAGSIFICPIADLCVTPKRKDW